MKLHTGFSILLFIVVFSCNNLVNTSKINVSNIDSTIVSSDSAIILGERYKAFFKTDDILYVINKAGDTILKAKNLQSNFEFIDFDRDNLLDIRINYMSNVPGIQDLLLFDKVDKRFKLVDGFSNYPDSKMIKGTKYFYSYHRSGCADMNWDSDLFFIDNFKTYCIGNISGRECNDSDEKKGIYVYAVNGDNKTLIKTCAIDTIQKFKETKWGFIDDYWKNNYIKFID